MKLFDNIINGATSQFGREFGRAAANSVLKGKNSYVIESPSYDGRIKPSDSELIKSIKQIKKLTFVSTDKANISRLIDITNIVLSLLKFNNVSTLIEINDYKKLIETYNQKYEHGRVLISDNNDSKELLYLQNVREVYENQIGVFNDELKVFVENAKNNSMNNRKKKSIALLLSFSLIGLHHFYLGDSKKGFSILIGIIIPFVNIFILLNNIYEFFRLLFLQKEKFDSIYNVDYVFFQRFTFIED